MKKYFLLLLLVICNQVQAQAPLHEDCDCDGIPSYIEVSSNTNTQRCRCSAVQAINYDCDDYNPNIQTIPWYYDEDGDGYGIYNPVITCESPGPKFSLFSGDCDDTDPTITNVNERPWYHDTNGDGIIGTYGKADNKEHDMWGFSCGKPYNCSDCLQELPNLSFRENYTEVLSFDPTGHLSSNSRTYFDALGKPNVTVSENPETGKVWGTETLYDTFGRIDKTSFIAPSSRSNLEKVNFFKTSTQLAANSVPNTLLITSTITSNKAATATETIVASSTINPNLTVSFTAKSISLENGFNVKATVGSSFTATATLLPDNSVNAILGNYYSDSNTEEPYQATAEQPYSQTNYDKLNPGNVINVVGGNKIDGEWKTGYSYTVPAAQEMYYVYGSDYYDGPIVNGKEEVITKFYKSVAVDANGVENVAFTDGEGKVLATARSGGSNSYPVVSLIGTQGFVDVHIPAGITSGISLIRPSYSYKVYDLKTGLIVSSLTGGNAYRIEAITPPTTEPKCYIVDGVPTYSSDALGIIYTVNYYDYAVNIYNKTGQLTKSIQPKGYVSSSRITGTPTHMNSTNFATTYQYNSLGQLIEVSSPDEGISKFAYRKDGQIRYSQSALQKDTKVSYTDYDSYARPIESGVITGENGIWDAATAAVDTNGLIGGSLSETVFTVYDEPINLSSNPNTLTSKRPIITINLSTVLTTAGLNPNNYLQQNLSGNVAITYNKPNGKLINAITWYSYDIYGRSEWMVQYNEGLGAKTIHYEYDYKGNVKKVLYQKDTAAELFVHQYTYDANNVLTKVQTSTDNSTFPVDAEYSYYLTGELKRVNIAQGAQGLDYVYTLGGALKSINHPSLEASKDPSGDTNDVFGVTLDYYKGDYLRTGRNITSSPTAGNDYNGNIKAVRWKNKGADPNGTNPKAYLYNYDRDNWLTSATYGDADDTTAAISPNAKYKEAGLSYDANGNIKTLQRSNDSGTVTDNLTYNYKQNQNQLEFVQENAAATTDKNDIENQNAGNYTYDAIGQLIRNNLEDLTYFYNTQGLVTEVQKGGNAVIKMYYNERGQRVKKESYNTGTFALISTDYYSLDLSGNVMAIYNKPAGSAIVLKENPIFGLSRLGVYYRGGVKNYQIADHLGNVRAVIKKEIVSGLTTILSYADYYPFGEQLPGRNSQGDYRYAFQGQELDKETGMEAFQLRLWDGRLGRWLSPDPYGQNYSPYMGMGNNPIGMIDPDGGYCYDSNGNTIPCGDFKEFNNSTSHMTFLNEVVINGTPKSGGLGMAGDIALGFVPGSDIIGMYQGARDGNWGQFAMSTAFFAFDVATLGSGSLVKGGLKAAIKVGEKQIVKQIAEEAAEFETKQLLLTAGKKALQKHHILPNQFRKWFAERGIKNIDDYTVKLSQRTHLSDVHNGAGQWNKKWQAFIEANPTASPNEIFHQAESMLNELGLQHLPYVKY